jgi:hypothetical protein
MGWAERLVNLIRNGQARPSTIYLYSRYCSDLKGKGNVVAQGEGDGIHVLRDVKEEMNGENSTAPEGFGEAREPLQMRVQGRGL